ITSLSQNVPSRLRSLSVSPFSFLLFVSPLSFHLFLLSPSFASICTSICASVHDCRRSHLLDWTQDEEDALIAGVEKHSPGKWKNILKDPQFAPFLTSRSNIDLKDKWRNLSVNNGSQGSKDKPRVPKLKALPPPPPPTSATSSTTTTAPQNAPPTPLNAQVEVAALDSSLNDQDVKKPPRYNAMVFEALSALKDNNGSDLNAIVSFIEQKHQVPQNFRRALSTRLMRLVSQGKLEKAPDIESCVSSPHEILGSSGGSKTP
ncbi:telomere repeat-binding factor 4-like, partial [Vigna unguiculata]|uniref:telomere repeat-binding factor 4-like n=1 Tax=Vigna unguiculata TaxID=3917 RepID=UPI001016405F